MQIDFKPMPGFKGEGRRAMVGWVYRLIAKVCIFLDGAKRAKLGSGQLWCRCKCTVPPTCPHGGRCGQRPCFHLDCLVKTSTRHEACLKLIHQQAKENKINITMIVF